MLASSDPDISTNLEVLWVSYSSAVEMLQLINRSASFLYFVQDSIHVMTAYSATFLVKVRNPCISYCHHILSVLANCAYQLLLSAHESVAGQIEPQVNTAIATAARVFSQQASPPGSSCTLQAKFLERIMSDFETMRQEQRLQKSQARTTEENTHASNTVPLLDENGTSRQAETVCQDVTFIDDVADRDGLHPVRQEFSFAEDEMWADMFANAGFNYQEGVFFA